MITMQMTAENILFVDVFTAMKTQFMWGDGLGCFVFNVLCNEGCFLNLLKEDRKAACVSTASA